jgi:glutamine kinase
MNREQQVLRVIMEGYGAMINFGTKAETLEQLSQILKTGKVLPQIRFTVKEWEYSEQDCLKPVFEKAWDDIPLIVRSSAVSEDLTSGSMAGKYLSLGNIKGKTGLIEAIGQVIRSFDNKNPNDQVFIQPMLQNVFVSGVAFGIDPNTGGNYIVINYDDQSGSTFSVTSGNSGDTKVFYFFKGCNKRPNNFLSMVINALLELEELFQNERLDLEFAVTKDQVLYILQVRPLCVKAECPDLESQSNHLERIAKKVESADEPKPYLFGSKTVFGVMPDWNPAEIIGIRPRPLALSLYKDLITDSIWAYQRDNYGYQNLRSFPLMLDFCGLPYIDVRVSFNSFLPKDLDSDLSEKLINYYIERLIETPGKHDKVEFEIVFSCYTLDLPERIIILKKYGFSEDEIRKICNSLKKLTNTIIDVNNGLWKKDADKIQELEKRRKIILESKVDKVTKIYWLLEDCKRYGTLPFAGLARAAFIAVQMLKSLVNIGVLSLTEYQNFIGELDNISSKMAYDFENTTKKIFLEKYGHLRPGTYDILSPRYDEQPDRYFDWDKKNTCTASIEKTNFVLSLKQIRTIKNLLAEHELLDDVLSLFDFIKSSIEGREYSKFIFTKSLSDALVLFGEVAKEQGYSLDDCSYADIGIIKKLYASDGDIGTVFEKSILEGKENYRITKQLMLPPVIIDADDVWSFQQPELNPNYITQKSIVGPVRFVNDNQEKLKGGILFIPSADPGYDWIFSHGIAGFVTMYGGINSHMSIRSGELGIPAVIGIGEQAYEKYSKARFIELDCAGRRVRILK